jgi:hypothetical protein
MGGAASGKYTVKSCGNAHAWCRVCRPEQIAKLSKPKPPPKPGMPPCRKCGRCDYCLGLTAPEGMKVCRDCRETKPLTAFSRRNDTGGYRNQCMKCHNGGMEIARCEGCGTKFGRWSDGRTLCEKCRPPLTKPCARCGTEFTGSMDQRRYCSAECRVAAFKEKRNAAHKSHRLKALQAYGGPVPACACCGERELLFLALDHVNGGGVQQRTDLGGGGYWNWLRKNNYPEGFRVLCHNCNHGRYLNGGTCPHEAAR